MTQRTALSDSRRGCRSLRGRKLKDLVEEGLRLVLETSRSTRERHSLAELMKGARGWHCRPRIQSRASHRLRPRCAPPSLTLDGWSLFSIGLIRNH